MEESKFDVIVLGTGLVESILAGALSRVGKTVLHLDNNQYYGGRWTALTLVDFIQHFQKILVEKIDSAQSNQATDPDPGAIDFFSNYANSFKDIDMQIYPEASEGDSPAETEVETSEEVANFIQELIGLLSAQSTCSTIAQKIEAFAKLTLGLNGRESEGAVAVESTRQAILLKSRWTGEQNGQESLVRSCVSRLSNAISRITTLLQRSRQYNLELAPKLLCCSDRLIDDLVASGVSRYLDFKLLEGTYMGWSGKYDKVPCSKEDIFTSKNLSLIEKRKLMKYLTYAMDTSADPTIINEYQDQPFDKMLREKFLIKDNLLNAVMYSIALIPTGKEAEVTSALGMERTQRYLKALGRYGNSAYLHTMYGSGSEISQGFCRLSAVYGGTYMLGHNITNIHFKEDDQVFEVACQDDHTFEAPLIVASSDYQSKHLNCSQEIKTTAISRGVFLLNKPVFPESQLIKIVTPPSFVNNQNPVFALQVNNGVQACPKDQFVVYMWTLSSSTAREDLFEVAESLLSLDGAHEEKPEVLVSLFYQQTVIKPDLTDKAPMNLFLTSDPDHEIDFANIAQEAHEIFKRICPGDEFLEPTPDPEIEAEYVHTE
ncbi:rab protein geranylgeranyltransferase component A [Basidiobolus meristosporus CBS 931.73]|uniref:Rab escort protein 1 n=1 Tax=Basidiobolus meristosporus CBS 931.73 TaxID=1314790 RepID=A0A1Y1Z4Y8_9FUNG|nr:rab protein geranylgeranyltransferase component A [Basidiobolus meristosporus CBS 931.73]|eukprot:ORY05348.1 rab protein geranylgeranyltransferase component A [Basidiobolus meristosporus CBS 931.73]